MPVKILCSTGALIGKPNKRDYRLLDTFADKLDCDGFEFMMYNSWYETREEMVKILRGYFLNIPVVHCEKRIGEAISIGGEDNFREALEKFEQNCELANELGAEHLVVHLWDGLTSDKNFRNNLTYFEKLEKITDAHGLHLLVENVVCNQKNPMLHWCELAEKYPSVRFVFDTKMAAFHGQVSLINEKEYEWLMKDRFIRHFHINDYNGDVMDWGSLESLPVGSGKIDFLPLFRLMKEYHYQGYLTVEATAFDSSGTVDLDMLNQTFRRIRELQNAAECV